ncbi:MAG TPA: tetratricopeptide repeat protein [Chitinophagaceae bacterium]
MKRRLLIVLVVLFTKLLHAQSPPTIDSLLRELKTVTDTNRVNVLDELCAEYRRRDADKSIQYGEEALAIAQNLRFEKGVTSAMQHLSGAYTEKGNYKQSLDLRLQLLEKYKKNGDAFNIGRTLHFIGNNYHSMSNYTKALDYYFNSIRWKEKTNDQEGIARTLYLIAIVYQDQKNDTLALKYYGNSISAYEKLNEYSGIAIVATSIGQIYQDQKNFIKALPYLEKALEASKKINSPEANHAIATALLNLSSVYKDSLNFEKALAYNAEVLKTAYRDNDPLIEALSFENSGRIYFNMNKLQESNNYFLKALKKYREAGDKNSIALIQNSLAENYLQLSDLENAEQYASAALQVTNHDAGLQLEAKDALELLIKITTAKGNYNKAFNYQQKYITLKDSLLSEEKSKEITRLEMLYETEKKEKEISLLKSEAEKAEILHYVMAGAALFIVITAFFLYNHQRVKNRKNKQLYESRQALSTAELNNAKLREDQLQRELEFKTKELTTSALNFIQKNSLMLELKDKIKEIQGKSDHGLSRELNKLQHIVDHSFNLDNDWNEFRLYFEQVHHNFLSNLKKRFPDLTNKELRLCALLRLNLNIKETTTLLGISAESVKVARYRLRKKLGLGGEENLNDFFMQTENGNQQAGIYHKDV